MIATNRFALYHTPMHALIPVLFSGRTVRFGVRAVCALFLLVLSATPALAQEPMSGRSGSLLNVLLLAAVAYFLVRSFRRRGGRGDDTRPGRWSRRDDDGESDDEGRRPDAPGKPMDRHEAARRTWDILSSDKQDRAEPTTPTGVSSDVRAENFDEVEFLEGAKLFFARFLQARSEGDLPAIRDFISDDVFNEAMSQGDGERTEVMLVNARLMELKSENGRTLATVFYDAQLRKGGQGERTEQVRQAWEFSRDDAKPGALWVLERINRVNH